MIPNSTPQAQVLNMKPVLNLGASVAGYVNSGSHALKVYAKQFIMPRTKARSSASPEQISLAQAMDSGPKAMAARLEKYANHCSPMGIDHIAKRREEKKPKKIAIDITKARLRR